MMSDVVIIGAGAAGLAAARDLVAAGAAVTLLEARDLIGGRMFSNRALSPILIELGAEFVHGRPPELIDLAAELNLKLIEVQGKEWCREADSLKPCSEHDDDLLDRMASYSGPDLSFCEYLNRFESGASHKAVQRAVQLVEGFNAADANHVSVEWLNFTSRAAAAVEGDLAFRIEGGYSLLAERMLPAQAHLRLNTVVEAVDWTPGSAMVRAAGEEWRARAVLLTLPLGVLQSGSFRFAPELPRIGAAAQRLAYGAAIRITLQFSARFWEKITPELGFLFLGQSDFPVWWSASHDWPVLTAWVGGPQAERLEVHSEQRLIDAAFESIQRAFSIDRKQLLSAHLHPWSSDRFSFGAYTYVPAGSMDAVRVLGQPEANTLFFAGEATDTSGHTGTVHGAIASGRRAAAEILAA